MTLVRIVKNWSTPDLLRQTKKKEGVWGGIQFTLADTEECDYLIFLNNNMPFFVHARCSPENIWAIMQEPYMRGHSDWMLEKHHFFSKVFTHHPSAAEPKYITSHPALPWHVNKTFDQLTTMHPPAKTQKISWVVGNADDLPGHAKRYAFLQTIQQDSTLDIALFGRAVRPIADKWDGLAPFQYSLAIENSSSPDYWTEKVADCFLSWTVPIYFGCTNLAKYFPKDSFIWLDITDPVRSLDRLKEILQNDDIGKRQAALAEARSLVLNQYQLFPFLAGMINRQKCPPRDVKSISIPHYQRSPRARIARLIYKFKKNLHLL